MPTHTVQPGDTLMALAAKYGLASWKDILDAPQNASIKQVSADPGILPKGVDLFIPNRELKQQPSAVDAVHPFVIKRPKAWLRVVVKDADGTPYSGCKYDLDVEGTRASGTLPQNALVELAVPVASQSGTLRVWPSGAGEPVTWNLQLGFLDPISQDSGVQQRLTNLGFDCGGDLTASVKAFQARIGAEVTGVIDDTLRNKLKSYYDNTADESQQDKKPEAAQ